MSSAGPANLNSHHPANMADIDTIAIIPIKPTPDIVHRMRPASSSPDIFFLAPIKSKASPIESGSIVHITAQTSHKPVMAQNWNNNPFAPMIKAGKPNPLVLCIRF